VLTKQQTSQSTQPTKQNVGMGEICHARDTGVLTTVLGSCVAVTLYHPRSKTGALAHIVLPVSMNREGKPGKFADTAVAQMCRTLSDLGLNVSGLVAKLTGGSEMFKTGGPLQIGPANIDAARKELQKMRIPIVAEHLAGNKGRRVTLDVATGELRVEIVGATLETI
jgi:chemotaxis protein CheD